MLDQHLSNDSHKFNNILLDCTATENYKEIFDYKIL